MATGADRPQQHRFFRRRSIPLPTWRLLIPLTGFAAILLGGFLKYAYPWLAITDPLSKAPYVIVEGWLPDYALQDAAAEARKDHVALTFCTGIPLDRGTMIHSFGNYANYAEETLAQMGVPSEKLTSCPAELAKVERTRTMARAVKARLATMDIPDGRHRVNLITLGSHARRSRQIYREELGKAWQVGVISVIDQETDPDRWFYESNSAKNVITELIALTLGMFGAN